MTRVKITLKPKELRADCDRNEFALALKTWRLRQGLTQAATARRWEVSRFTIMRAEAAKNITWEMAYRLFARLSHELEIEQHKHEIHHDN